MTDRDRKLRTLQRELSIAAFALVGLAIWQSRPEIFAASFSMIAANAVIQGIRIGGPNQ